MSNLRRWARWWVRKHTLEAEHQALLRRIVDESVSDHQAMAAARQAERLEDLMSRSSGEEAMAEAIVALAEAVERLASAVRDILDGEEDQAFPREKLANAEKIVSAIIAVTLKS